MTSISNIFCSHRSINFRLNFSKVSIARKFRISFSFIFVDFEKHVSIFLSTIISIWRNIYFWKIDAFSSIRWRAFRCSNYSLKNNYYCQSFYFVFETHVVNREIRCRWNEIVYFDDWNNCVNFWFIIFEWIFQCDDDLFDCHDHFCD